MKRIGITGSSGFIGRHLCGILHVQKDIEIISISREQLENPIHLIKVIEPCDTIIHLAGTNIGNDNMLRHVNVELTQHIVDACRAAKITPHILFASSIFAERQIENPTRSVVFGMTKREAAHVLSMWGMESGAHISIFLLPHVFGEFALPFHNSAIATLCHQLVRGEQFEVRPEATIEPVYVRDVVIQFLKIIQERKSGEFHFDVVKHSLADIVVLLKTLNEEYIDGSLKILPDTLSINLFLTLQYHRILWELSSVKNYE